MRFLLTALLALTIASAAAAVEKPWNVLFVIADDLNCDLGCYGHKIVQSPNLDRLAARSVRFERTYVQYTVCNPSRTSFLTGLRPTTTGIMDNQTHFRKKAPAAVTLPELFRKNGYYTAGLGKVFHRGLSPDELRPDMDDPPSFEHVFYGKATPTGNRGTGRNLTGGKLPWCRWLAAEGTDEDQPDGQITAEAIRLLERHKDRPFFLAVGYYRPHDPYQSPKQYFDQYPLDKLDLPRTPAGYQPPFPHSIPGGAFTTAFKQFGDAEKREYLRAYYAGVSFTDAQVGKLLAALERLQLSARTIVVFLGDHGYELGTRDWWNKNTLFEGSCRAPLIVHVPEGKGNGRATMAITEMLDLYPTLAELCQLKGLPRNLEGTSFQATLEDPAREGKPAAITVIQRAKVQGRTVRTVRWRYTEWDGGAAGVELYDHTLDPGEWTNLGADPQFANVRKELAKLLTR